MSTTFVLVIVACTTQAWITVDRKRKVLGELLYSTCQLMNRYMIFWKG